jgi:L-alanine-DL-glutamate epimerase-like enolase superfamily enzyme
VDTVAKIDIFEAKVPLTKPLSVGSAKITYRSYTVVKVTTTDGIEGIGYCYSRGLPMGQIINNVMAPIAIGNSAEAPNDLRKEILAFNWQSAEHGTLTAALSALDLAMYDIQAKRQGKSIASMLGATRDRIPVYSVVGYNYGSDESGLVEEIAYARNRGINSFKIIVGGQTPERDAKRLQVLRREVGEGVGVVKIEMAVVW